MARVDVQSFRRERGDDVVFRRFRVAARHGDRCATGSQHQGEVGRLGLQMDADGKPFAGERALGGELLFQLPQYRHVAPYPVDLEPTLCGELRGGHDVALHVKSRVDVAERRV